MKLSKFSGSFRLFIWPHFLILELPHLPNFLTESLTRMLTVVALFLSVLGTFSVIAFFEHKPLIGIGLTSFATIVYLVLGRHMLKHLDGIREMRR